MELEENPPKEFVESNLAQLEQSIILSMADNDQSKVDNQQSSIAQKQRGRPGRKKKAEVEERKIALMQDLPRKLTRASDSKQAENQDIKGKSALHALTQNGRIEGNPSSDSCVQVSQDQYQVYRSHAPDFLLNLIDAVIQVDIQCVLRKRFICKKVDELVYTFADNQVKKIYPTKEQSNFEQDSQDIYELIKIEVGASEDIFCEFIEYSEIEEEKYLILKNKSLSNHLKLAFIDDIQFRVSESQIMSNEEWKQCLELLSSQHLAVISQTSVTSIDVIRNRVISQIQSKKNLVVQLIEGRVWHHLLSRLQNQKIINQSTYQPLLFHCSNVVLQFLKAQSNSYLSISDLDNDMRKLLNYTLQFRCRSWKAYRYLTGIVSKYKSLLMSEQFSSSTFDEIKLKDFNTLFHRDLQHKIQAKKWPLIPTSYRNYEQIVEYDCQPPTLGHFIKEKLKSDKVAEVCQKKCVCKQGFTKLGLFDLETFKWNSKCANRRNRIECPQECEDCNNQQVSKQLRKIVGKDVQETPCWGVDLYTKKNIFHLLPEHYLDHDKDCFIQYQLMKAINLQKEKGWDIMSSCEFILANSHSKLQRIENVIEPSSGLFFNNDSRKCTKALFKAIKFITHHYLEKNLLGKIEEQIFREAYRVHTKGIGLICINPNGIEQNEFITEYIGEIYQPWRWFEKQEAIKKCLKDSNQKDFLPDFWNIMLEIHKDDPKGYDILFVDPILKGNFSSRLSHSCEPNCGTVPSITNESNYVIGMYAMLPIEYGEELSFDYMAVTESLQEHQVILKIECE